MKIAIDVMGGDNAPNAIVEGSVLALNEDKNLEIYLVGDEEKIKELITTNLSNINIINATDVINGEEEPTRAIRKKDSSMMKTINLLKEGVVEAIVSAGNTGAYMAGSLIQIGRLEGVLRPALSPILPTINKNGVLVLDVGANVDSKPEHLIQYAIMGSIYVEKILGRKNPTVGLLNIGTEDKKGNELTKATFPLLKENANINFIGNVEARDVLYGVCDVVVCDGFAGNILLKSTEGTAGLIFTLMKEQLTKGLKNKVGALLLKSGLKEMKNNMDYKEYGGTILLGLKKPCIKAHGSSDAVAIKNAILQAKRLTESNLIQKIEKEIKHI